MLFPEIELAAFFGSLCLLPGSAFSLFLSLSLVLTIDYQSLSSEDDESGRHVRFLWLVACELRIVNCELKLEGLYHGMYISYHLDMYAWEAYSMFFLKQCHS